MSEWQMFGLIAICMVHCMWLVDQEKKRFNREIEKAHERISESLRTTFALNIIGSMRRWKKFRPCCSTP